MTKYLVNVSYTTAGIAGLHKEGGAKRQLVVQHALESLGGRLESFYFCFGDHDAIVIADLPDAVAAAALSVAVGAAGVARCSSTPLLTAAEMDHACSKMTAYKAPGA